MLSSTDGADAPRPPRPRLVLGVGVTGHRPDKLSAADLARVRAEAARALGEAARILAGIAAEDRAAAAPMFSTEPPVLRFLSPLAEGTDRIAAEEALALADRVAVELHCPLPFAREEYRKDFAGPSAEEFDRLLARGRAFELDGERGDSPGAYEAAGWLLLDNCDLLLAVWDGREARGVGGTARIVREALRRGIPTVWIHAAGGADAPPHACCLPRWEPAGTRCGPGVEELAARVREALLPAQAKAAARHFAERARRWNSGLPWRFFRDLLGRGRLTLGPLRLAAPAQGGHYEWADHLAEHYAGAYRSSFLLNYLLGAAAVALALTPVGLAAAVDEHALHALLPWFTGAELLAILAILANTLSGTRRGWHERWLDCRMLAEYLRQSRALAALGRDELLALPPSPRVSGEPRGSWIYWLARRAGRERGLPAAKVDAAALESYRAALRRHIVEQVDYHERNARLLHGMERRLAAGGTALFAATLAACAAHFALHSPWLTWIAAVFPAFAAACAGIRGHAELELGVKRSEAAHAGLARLVRELDRPELPPTARALGALGRDAARLMLEESSAWRLVSEARPLELA